MKKIFYYLRSGARGRQVDAALYPPEGYRAILPRRWTNVVEGAVVRRRQFLSRLIRFHPFLMNIKDLPEEAREADVAYTFGALLKDNVPYVVEIDNPTCLTYYSPLSLLNPAVRWLVMRYIRRQNFISFLPMSRAALYGLINALGEEIREKATVVYPPFPYEISKKESSIPSFIFISYNFWIKGGREVLMAAKKLEGKFRITMITELPKEYEDVAKEIGVRVLPRLERMKLLRLIAEHDVVVHPSYMDSFGIAPYEAINIGLAGIATDMYALPEFIHHERNGFILPSPVKYFDERGLPNLRFWLFEDVEGYVRRHRFPSVEKALQEYMQYYIDNHGELRKHQLYSKELAKREFSMKRRNKILARILANV